MLTATPPRYERGRHAECKQLGGRPGGRREGVTTAYCKTAGHRMVWRGRMATARCTRIDRRAGQHVPEFHRGAANACYQ